MLIIIFIIVIIDFNWHKNESKVLQYFGIETYNLEAEKAFADDWRWWTLLDWWKSSSLDNLQLLLVRFASVAWSTAFESTVLTFTDLAWLSVSYNLSEIFWPICLLYCDQLHLFLSHKKCFWLLLRYYVLVWPIKWNTVFSKQRSCWYCYMPAPYGH